VAKLSFLSIGSLGTGFVEASLERGLERPVDFIGADAGSTDGGPSFLAGRGASFGRAAYYRDLKLLLRASRRAGVPLLVGSCATSGSNWGVDYFAEMARQAAAEDGLEDFTLAKIYTEIEPQVIVKHLENGNVTPLRPVLPYDADTAMRSTRIVGVLGAEPFQEALRQGADVVLAGRSTDTAIFASIPLVHGIDPGIAWHSGKVAECGTAAAEPRLRLDVLRIEIDDDAFYVEALRDEVRCTPFSVSGVQLHEVSNPFTMVEPGVSVDLSGVKYEAVTDRKVRVRGASATKMPYTVKLEGVEPAGYQRMFFFAVHDPTILENLDAWLMSVENDIQGRVGEIAGRDAYAQCEVHRNVYGRDGVMGPRDPVGHFEGHEALILVDVVAPDPEMCEAVTDVVEYAYLHAKSTVWRGGATMAFPLQKRTFDVGEVFKFNVNHVVHTDDPMELCSIELETVKGVK
jgi:hypothetical protein